MLQPYNFANIIYCNGAENGNADGLSQVFQDWYSCTCKDHRKRAIAASVAEQICAHETRCILLRCIMKSCAECTTARFCAKYCLTAFFSHFLAVHCANCVSACVRSVPRDNAGGTLHGSPKKCAGIPAIAGTCFPVHWQFQCLHRGPATSTFKERGRPRQSVYWLCVNLLKVYRKNTASKPPLWYGDNVGLHLIIITYPIM